MQIICYDHNLIIYRILIDKLKIITVTYRIIEKAYLDPYQSISREIKLFKTIKDSFLQIKFCVIDIK